jgi:hypothetical protein
MIRIHEVENRVQGHRDAKEHVQSVFDNVIFNPDHVAPDAEVYVIAIEGGTECILDLLAEDCELENFLALKAPLTRKVEKYGPRITAMALIHSLVDDSQIKDSNIRAFLHQRVREWRYSDLSINPHDCTKLPESYESLQDMSTNARVAHHIAWNEDIPKSSVLSGISSALHRLVNVASSKNADKTSAVSDASADWSSGMVPICPTFAGGRDSAGECILTNFAVQHAVLEFFEEVAQNSENYSNPNFKPFKHAPQPSPDNPLALDPDNPDVAGFSSLPPEITPEQTEIYMAKEKLEQMKLAVRACPASVSELQQGRTKLIERIANQKTKIEKLEKKALATGGLKAEEAPEQRENWRLQKEGQKIKFAGTEVDSELLKAAGLMDTTEEELKKLEIDGA